MSRRDRIDPETARLVEERLQWLLHEHGPVPERRTESPPQPSGSAGASDSAGRSGEVNRPSRSRRSSLHPTEGVAAPDLPEVPERTPQATSDGRVLATLTAFRRPHLVVVAVIVAVGILVAGWAVLRARPVAVAVTPPVASTAPTGVPTENPVEPGTSAGPTPSVAGVVVHVLGAVRKPGLVTLTAGSRVQDAIAAAGGLTAKADPGELNLAQAVTDGQQIVVGTTKKPAGEVRNGTAGGSSGGAGPGGSGTAGSGTGGSGLPVDLNTASQAELEGLPGVGPVMAGKILAWRSENGRFSRVEELQEIDGVGPKTYAKLAPLCRV
jgi:competence protein ComEA